MKQIFATSTLQATCDSTLITCTGKEMAERIENGSVSKVSLWWDRYERSIDDGDEILEIRTNP